MGSRSLIRNLDRTMKNFRLLTLALGLVLSGLPAAIAGPCATRTPNCVGVAGIVQTFEGCCQDPGDLRCYHVYSNTKTCNDGDGKPARVITQYFNYYQDSASTCYGSTVSTGCI